jgi:hypothetical protein
VQGAGADGLKLALALLYERRGKCSGAVLILAVHDELVVECPEGQVKDVMRFVDEVMVAGMDDVLNGKGGEGAHVLVEVEVEMAETWAGWFARRCGLGTQVHLDEEVGHFDSRQQGGDLSRGCLDELFATDY